MLLKRFAIDLGTNNIVIYVPKKGIVVNEPNIVALNSSGEIEAIGSRAKEMLGRTPENMEANAPLVDGVIADFKTTQNVLKYYINNIAGSFRLVRPEIMVSIPTGITSTEKRAVHDALISAGAKKVYIIKSPVAAAIGANVPISEPAGNLVVSLGGGTTEIAIISLGGIVAQSSIRVGGVKIDRSIADYTRKNYGLIIGSQTAEEIKKEIGTALPMDKPQKKQVSGRDLVTGMPRMIDLHSNEIAHAISDRLEEIMLAIKNVLEQTPPELSSDIIDRGIVLTGGLAYLKNLDKLMAKITGVPITIAADPNLCVVRGAALALENLDEYLKSIISK
jgi:rod shape-determining protein MreB